VLCGGGWTQNTNYTLFFFTFWDHDNIWRRFNDNKVEGHVEAGLSVEKDGKVAKI